MTGNPLNTVRKQRALTPRKEPYWHAFRRGAALGIYVGAASRTWVARAKDPTGTYRLSTLGALEDFDYGEAETKARAFADLTGRNERPNYTVGDAIADYAEDAKVRNGESSSKGIRQRLARAVPPELTARRLSDLRSIEVRRWRDGMVCESTDAEAVQRSKDTANRVLGMLKAALNFAFKSGYAASDGEWRRVTAFEDVGEPRRLFLTPEQVRALLDTAEGSFRDLLKAATLTGARYGELTAAKVRDFDGRSGTLHLAGKTGPRTCYLSRDAVEFFRTLARDKLPDAFLLMKDDGTPWGKSHQHRPMKAAAKAAGLPSETVFYSLRHYHISRALLAGMNAQVIAENCGTSVRMIEKHYGKFTRADRRAMLNMVQL